MATARLTHKEKAARVTSIVAGAYVVLQADEYVQCNATAGNVTPTLPDRATNRGLAFTFVKTDATANTVIVTRAGADTIDGAATYTLTDQYQAVTLVAGTDGWYAYATNATGGSPSGAGTPTILFVDAAAAGPGTGTAMDPFAAIATCMTAIGASAETAFEVVVGPGSYGAVAIPSGKYVTFSGTWSDLSDFGAVTVTNDDPAGVVLVFQRLGIASFTLTQDAGGANNDVTLRDCAVSGAITESGSPPGTSTWAFERVAGGSYTLRSTSTSTFDSSTPSSVSAGTQIYSASAVGGSVLGSGFSNDIRFFRRSSAASLGFTAPTGTVTTDPESQALLPASPTNGTYAGQAFASGVGSFVWTVQGSGAWSLVAGTGAVGIANNATDHSTTVGSITGASPLTQRSGTGAMTFNAGGILDMNVTGAATLDAASFSIDATGASNVSVTGANLTLSTITSGTLAIVGAAVLDMDAVGALSINSSGGPINIGDDAVGQAINLGTGAAARVITQGNGTGATSWTVNVGTGGASLGANATDHATTVGSTTGASPLLFQSGSGNITMTAPLVIVGTALRTPNTGLRAFDTDASHTLTFRPGANLSGDRVLTWTTKDADQTVSFDGSVGQVLVQDGSGNWSPGSVADLTGVVGCIAVAVSGAAGAGTFTSTAQIPAGAVVTEVRANITVLFNGTTPDVIVGVGGTTNKFVSAATFDITSATLQEATQITAQASAAAVVVTTSGAGMSAGTMTIYVFYVVPRT